MSPTLSPAHPVHSLTPVLNKEESELQAFLAAAKCEAQKKWEKLHVAKTSGVVEKAVRGGEEIVAVKEVIEKGVDDIIEVEREAVPKVEPKPHKVTVKMVAGMPHCFSVYM